MINSPFDKPGKFWKGNIHTHSTVSDGRLTPLQVCEKYREIGYDFLSITDHFMNRFEWKIADATACTTDDFLTIIGAELHVHGTEFGQLWHILAIDLPLDFAPVGKNETPALLVQRALKEGAFVAVAHPAMVNLSEADVLSLGNVHAIEVYNGTAKGQSDKPDSWYLLDRLSAYNHRYSATASDDAHFVPARSEYGLAWIMVKSETLSRKDIMFALKNGHFYSSTGPEIHNVHIDRNRLNVECSPVEGIYVTGAGYANVRSLGTNLTKATFNIRELMDSPFVRVTIRASDGCRAWTSPMFFEER